MSAYHNTLFVTTPGAYLAKDRENVEVRVERQARMSVPLHHLGGVVCLGPVWILRLSIATPNAELRTPNEKNYNSKAFITLIAVGQLSASPTTRPCGDHGRVRNGSPTPKTPTTGASTAAAKCIGPESLATVISARAHTAA